MLLDVLTIDLQGGPTGLKDQTIAGMSMAMTLWFSVSYFIGPIFRLYVAVDASVFE